MDWFAEPNWQTMFTITVPLLEVFIRGTVMYLTLFFMMRIFKRQAGSVGISDILVMVLIADAAQNGMSGDYVSIPDGIALVSTIIFWNYVLDWAAYRFPWTERWLFSTPLQLIKNGRMIRQNMAREYITEDELLSHLREKGVEKISDVKTACLEGDGKISVVKK